MRLSGLIAVSFLSAVVAMTGCKRDSEQSSTTEPEVSLLDSTYAEVSDLLQNQGRDIAVVRMRALLSTEEYQDIRSNVFGWLLDAYLNDDDLAEAQAVYLELGNDNPDLAMAGFSQMMQASTSSDIDASVAWFERLIATRFPVELRVAAWQNRMAAYAKSGSIAPAVERIPEILSGDISSGARAIFSVALAQGLLIPDLEGTSSLLDALQNQAEDQMDIKQLVLITRGDVLTKKGELDRAKELYAENIAVIGDPDLSRGLVSLLKEAQIQNRADLLSQIVLNAYEQGSEFPSTRDAVASWAVDAAVQSGDPFKLFSETQNALDAGASIAKIFPIFIKGFYPIIQNSTTDVQEKMLALIQRMRDAPETSERLRGLMGTTLLDGAFFMQDFKEALTLIDSGIEGFDENWHIELRDKINAHLALQENRYEDAVTLFEKHIDRVSAWMSPVTNPEDGMPIIKEVVLGFNEKRIGDIWAKVPDREAESKAAYARAQEWYLKALDLLEEGSVAHQRAAEELAAVPTVQ